MTAVATAACLILDSAMAAVASMPATPSAPSLPLPHHPRRTLRRRRMSEQRHGVARLAGLSENPMAAELLQDAAGARGHSSALQQKLDGLPAWVQVVLSNGRQWLKNSQHISAMDDDVLGSGLR